MDLYCKIFLDTVSDYNEVFGAMKKFVCGRKLAISFIISEWCIIDVRENKEYIPKSSDFLYWKYIIDIEPQNISADFYIDKIKNLMCFLGKKYSGAVIACDFEDIFKKS